MYLCANKTSDIEVQHRFGWTSNIDEDLRIERSSLYSRFPRYEKKKKDTTVVKHKFSKFFFPSDTLKVLDENLVQKTGRRSLPQSCKYIRTIILPSLTYKKANKSKIKIMLTFHQQLSTDRNLLRPPAKKSSLHCTSFVEDQINNRTELKFHSGKSTPCMFSSSGSQFFVSDHIWIISAVRNRQ